MIEAAQNIFDPDFINTVDVICFTSNGVVSSNGCLVMGAGVAKEFSNRHTWLPKAMGKMVKTFGNVPNYVKIDPISNTLLKPIICSFPTKNHYKDMSDLGLIKQSAIILSRIATSNNWSKIALPFPGIGLGKLSKSSVKAAIENILDDRFLVLTK